MESKNAIYTGFQFEVNGYPALAVINTDLKNLEDKASYSYSVFIEVIPDVFNEMGHPEGEEYDRLTEIEKEIMEYLEGQTESVHVGHTTVYRKREIIFYTKEPEKVRSFLNYYLPESGKEASFDIESDPAWEDVSGFYEQI
ncbi:MAG TPA: DUF695 domain-containing protein [Chitinophagaceae bacterium]|nr:DUF695 domain-containing protein [Chitinophagaceae bacterium]